jgi:DNA (cytosine-5)-methyltransferase 1
MTKNDATLMSHVYLSPNFNGTLMILHKKQPKFFVAENVRGILSPRNKVAFDEICESFSDAGYDLFVDYLNAADFDVPQNRERVFFIGFQKDLNVKYNFPKPLNRKITVRDAIGDLSVNAVAWKKGFTCRIENHEYWEGGYSYIFMSRNRVLNWDSQSFTIQASGRQTSIHPQAPFMEKVKQDVMRFIPGKEHLYRRLTVRECARLQTFPDDFSFRYNNLNDGYKMVGNAVPVNLAYHVAKSIICVLNSNVSY